MVLPSGACCCAILVTAAAAAAADTPYGLTPLHTHTSLKIPPPHDTQAQHGGHGVGLGEEEGSALSPTNTAPMVTIAAPVVWAGGWQGGGGS